MILLLTLILNTTNVHAQSAEDQTRFAAHVGSSFMIDTIAYGVNRKAFGMTKFESEALATIETLIVGSLYKAGQNAGNTDTSRAFIENSVGIGLAIGAHWTFEF